MPRALAGAIPPQQGLQPYFKSNDPDPTKIMRPSSTALEHYDHTTLLPAKLHNAVRAFQHQNRNAAAATGATVALDAKNQNCELK